MDRTNGFRGFPLEGNVFRYSSFVPRLVNYCKSLGFQSDLIVPSCAFCSDENQGYPTILITQHFGTFPFNHGRVGGVVATGRHGPHAQHGQDLVIIQATHVGYNPSTLAFGEYFRARTIDHSISTSCGKIAAAISWYLGEYKDAQDSIFLEEDGTGVPLVTIGLQFLELDREEGLFLDLKNMIGDPEPRSLDSRCSTAYSTSRSFVPSEALQKHVRAKLRMWPRKRRTIGNLLDASFFHFKRVVQPCEDNENALESNLLISMPWVVTARWPMSVAAQICSQVEFYRVYRSIVKDRNYRGKNLVYISGLNIDISPGPGQKNFPFTKFVPWAAFVQQSDGKQYTIEQPELVQILRAQNDSNSDQLRFDDSIHSMETAAEIPLVETPALSE